MSIDNIQMAKRILKLVQSPEKFDEIAKYGSSRFQLTKKDFDAFREKTNIDYLNNLLKKRMSESNHSLQEPQTYHQRTQTLWCTHEHKSYIWISVCFSYINQTGNINQLQDKQTFLNWVFCYKSEAFLRYYDRSLLKEDKIDREKWPSEEVNLLLEILNRPACKLKWAKASIALFIESNGTYYRSAQRCREKWFNRLNPSVNHNKWTIQEDERLVAYVYQNGKRWAQISKSFNGTRNQHMVKNRFNSLLKKYKSIIKSKLTDKFLMALLKFLRHQILKRTNLKKQADKTLIQTQQSIMQEDIFCFQIDEIQPSRRPIEQQELNLIWPQLLMQRWQQFQQNKYLQQSQEHMSIPYFQKRLFLIDQSLANIKTYPYY